MRKNCRVISIAVIGAIRNVVLGSFGSSTITLHVHLTMHLYDSVINLFIQLLRTVSCMYVLVPML